jgi:hypothetical protein
MPIRQHYPALPIHIILSIRHLLTQLQPLPVCVLNRYPIGLIPARPYHQIGPVHILPLLLGTPRLHHPHSLLLPPHDPQVQVLRVPSQTREGIEVAVLLAEFILLKLVVAVFLSVRDLVVENLNLLAEEDLDVTLRIVREGGEVKLPVVVVKETETDAETVAKLGRVFLFWAFVR